MVRMMVSFALTRRSRPDGVILRCTTALLLRRIEWMTSEVFTWMILIHPFVVPAMMWFPDGVKTATEVNCFASCAACFPLFSFS